MKHRPATLYFDDAKERDETARVFKKCLKEAGIKVSNMQDLQEPYPYLHRVWLCIANTPIDPSPRLD